WQGWECIYHRTFVTTVASAQRTDSLGLLISSSTLYDDDASGALVWHGGYSNQGFDPNLDYVLGRREGFTLGESRGYAHVYQDAYDASYAVAFPRGVDEGTSTGRAAGEVDGSQEGRQEGASAG